MKELINYLIDQVVWLDNNKNVSLKVIIILIAMLIASAVYVSISNYSEGYFSLKGLFHLDEKEKRKYDFYSGDKNLIFYKISEYLEDENYSFITITNKPTNGSIDNRDKISINGNPSFGLADKSMINMVGKDELNEQIDFITDLYYDRLYIIYNKKRLSQLKKGKTTNKDDIEISPTSSRRVLELFADAKINLGPIGSGSRILSESIMNDVNRQINELNKQLNSSDSKISNGNFHKDDADIQHAIEKLEKEEIDIAFFLMGCMTEDMMQKLFLHKDNFALVGVESSMVSHLNEIEKFNLKSVPYKDSHFDNSNSMTLGDPVYLISNKDIPSDDILEVLKKLNEFKYSCSNDDNNKHRLFSEIPFYKKYKNKYENESYNNLRETLLYFASVLFSFVISVIYLLNLLTSIKRNKFLRRLKFISNGIPNNSEFKNSNFEDEYKLIQPFIVDNQIPVINKIIFGIKDLNNLRKELSDETRLNDESLEFIQNRIDHIMEKFRKSLYIRLNEIKERGELSNLGISKEDIRHYFTADWITYESYRKLVENMY